MNSSANSVSTKFVESVGDLPQAHFDFAAEKMAAVAASRLNGCSKGDPSLAAALRDHLTKDRILSIVNEGLKGNASKLEQLAEQGGEVQAHGINKIGNGVFITARGGIIECGFDEGRDLINSRVFGVTAFDLVQLHNPEVSIEWPEGQAPALPTNEQIWFPGQAGRTTPRGADMGVILDAPVYDPQTKRIERITTGYGKQIIPGVNLELA